MLAHLVEDAGLSDAPLLHRLGDLAAGLAEAAAMVLSRLSTLWKHQTAF